MEVSLGLVLSGLGELPKHPKLECHHLCLLVVWGLLLQEVVHEGHTQLLFLGWKSEVIKWALVRIHVIDSDVALVMLLW